MPVLIIRMTIAGLEVFKVVKKYYDKEIITENIFLSEDGARNFIRRKFGNVPIRLHNFKGKGLVVYEPAYVETRMEGATRD